jgi:hypothetical protein
MTATAPAYVLHETPGTLGITTETVLSELVPGRTAPTYRKVAVGTRDALARLADRLNDTVGLAAKLAEVEKVKRAVATKHARYVLAADGYVVDLATAEVTDGSTGNPREAVGHLNDGTIERGSFRWRPLAAPADEPKPERYTVRTLDSGAHGIYDAERDRFAASGYGARQWVDRALDDLRSGKYAADDLSWKSSGSFTLRAS